MGKTRKISTKMLLGVIPFLVISNLILIFLSVSTFKKTINEETKNKLETEVESSVNNFNALISNIKSTTINLGRFVGDTYEGREINDYTSLMDNILKDNNMIIGCGIWFEPNLYKDGETYVGPYWRRDHGETKVTYDYCTKENNYFEKVFYKKGKHAKRTAAFVDPYFDEIQKVTKMTCSTPIINKQGMIIGVVTIDTSLDLLESIVKTIQTQKNRNSVLLTADGRYLVSDEVEKVNSYAKINEDENTSIHKAAQSILENETGQVSYQKKNNSYEVYYATIPNVGWKLLIEIPKSMIDGPIQKMSIRLYFIAFASLFVCIISVLVQAKVIGKGIRRVKGFADTLAKGNYKTEKLKRVTHDEIGEVSEALNKMYENNKEIICSIQKESKDIKAGSEELKDATIQLDLQFSDIMNVMKEINESMLSSSTATEQVNASVKNMNTSIFVLTQETNESSKEVLRIQKNAVNIEENSNQAYQNAIHLYSKRQKELEKACEKAKVVQNIGQLATVILGIAEQIDLLSLNASIEAARAGEYGKGFAVVASEIKSLANNTTKAVDEIQTTVNEVQNAFDSMNQSSKEILEFIEETVAVDYKQFVKASKEYENSANIFRKMTQKTTELSSAIQITMEEVRVAIQQIASVTHETAVSSNKITKNAQKISEVATKVSNLSRNQDDVARQLHEITNQFEI